MKIKTECHGEVEVLANSWYNVLNYSKVYGNMPYGLCIGIVTIKNDFGKIKSYIGLGKGQEFEEDLRLVLDCGVPYYSESDLV